DHWIELVAFDFDAAAEWGLELASVGDRGSTPPDRVEERFEVGRLVEALRLGQLHLLEGPGAGFDLPYDLQFLAECIVLDGAEVDQVLGSSYKLNVGCAQTHVGHHVAALSNNGELALLWGGMKHLHLYRIISLYIAL